MAVARPSAGQRQARTGTMHPTSPRFAVREWQAAFLYATASAEAYETTVNNAFIPASGGAISFGAWVKRSFKQVGATNVVISKGRTAPNSNLCWTLQYTNVGLVQAGVSSNGTSAFLVTSTATFLDTQWHHVVGVYDNTNLTVYVDGVSVASSISAPTMLYNATSMPVGVGIAVTATTPSLTFAASWTGAITEAFVTVQALTQAQIATIMQQGAWNVLNGMGVAQAVWPANEGTGTVGADLAGGAGLTYANAAWNWLSLGRLRNQLQIPQLPMGVAV